MPAATSHASARADPHRAQTHPLPPAKKTRTVRRRGRGRNDFGSDEELEREVGTDPESDDDHSSVDSTTDSDTEPVSDEVPSTTPSRILTPNTTQSSADVPSLNGPTSKPTKGGDADSAPFFGDPGSWSEMVAEENAHGPAGLPVVEFADFTGSSMDQRPKPTPQRKPTKPSKRPPVKRAASAPTVDRPAVHSSPVSEQLDDFRPEPTSDQPVASTSWQSSRSGFRRPPGQSARQAYQQRLESDPSYVPTVGEFWGHDDRLLDKNLRSLSGWWRGRWQGRGRGRFDRGFVRGRGRGASVSGPGPALNSTHSEDGLATQESPPVELPRVDQPWTHDGFEEMKKRDEKRREVTQQQPSARPTRGFAPFRGRGGFVGGRGRGGVARGGRATPQSLRATATAASTPGKIWYAMKPEYPWTKHLETSLFHDSAPKPRSGSSPSYRVKLPNVEAHIVRGSAQAAERSKPPPSPESYTSEDGEKNFVVRLPKWSAKEKVVQPDSVSTTTVKEPHLEDVFTVRPELVPPRAPTVDIKLPSTSTTVKASDAAAPIAGPSTQPTESSVALSSPVPLPVQAQPPQPVPGPVDGVLHGHQDAVAPTLLKADTPHAPDAQDIPSGRRTLPPAPPPLQTVFTPPQSSPPYSSPYGYGSPLPPGIAISQHGMAYEIATGRPVYLPAPIYTPRPLAHGMLTPPGVSFMPGHMHHHPTGSPDFLSAPHTPPLNGFIDPTTGGPMFAFPRQSSRVEIRAPSLQLEPKSQRRPSSLRTSAAAFEPSRPSSPDNDAQSSAPRTEPYPLHDASEGQDDANPTSEQPVDPAVYNYTAYPQAYYYPEQYGYSQYYDMSHVSRYEMYQTDPHASQAVYY